MIVVVLGYGTTVAVMVSPDSDLAVDVAVW